MLDRFGPRIGVLAERREVAANFISRNIGKWLWFIKTVPFISPPGLAVMGALGISMRRFIWWDVVIVALTSLLFTAIGYYSGEGYGLLKNAVGHGTLLLAGIFVLMVAATYVYNRIAQRITRRMRQMGSEETGAGQ